MTIDRVLLEEGGCCDEKPEGKDNSLMSRLLQSRIVMVAGEVDMDLAEKVITQLLLLDSASQEPIKVVINTPGGHVDSGYAIHDVMRFVGSPVITIGAGWVASIGVPILLGGDKDKRVSLPNTRYLLHQPSGGAGGQAADIRIEAQEILKIRKRINEMIAAETGQPVVKVAKDSDRNFWMSAEEALEYGLVSKIVSTMAELG
ncbi:MAG: ATP-dependent Clp protease proteolytic subunit [Candidatus Hydrogenedentes bacterium]|nr:ATP-dependent Clp protease proteolytic subunit [Candidatus Hydrogenedentota bacterium]